jgi:hypothetical protein
LDLHGIDDYSAGVSGYWSDIKYSTIEHAYHSAFSSIGINETFGSFAPDTVNDWLQPTPGNIVSYTNIWAHSVYYYCISFPCSNANPLPVPPQTLNVPVMHATQTWRAGHATAGSGVVVKVDTIQYYTDHGCDN